MPPTGGERTSLGATLSATFAPAWGAFSPGLPVAPEPAQPVRRFDFPAGYNTVTTPRAYEPFGFAQLRAFANVELVRLGIETRKDQLERLDWRIKARAGRGAAHHDSVRRMENFWRKPDGATPFASWLRMLIEDVLTIDAPALEKRRNRRGDLVALDVIPGDTIRLLVDETGRRPAPPAPAYQQVIKGRVWADLTAADLIYAPRNPRPNHLYGFGPVEQIIVTLNTLMYRQARQLAYFSEGNLPAGLINAPEGWQPDQLRDYQDWFDARLAGNTAERSRLIWGPAGARYQAFKDSPIKDEFDEWLARVVCYCLSLPPTPFVRQMNRGTAQEDDSRALEEGLEPLMRFVKRLIDGVIADDLGCPELEFAWIAARDVDPGKQAEIHDRALRNGSMTINEVRAARGEEPIPGGDVAMIYTGAGAVALADVGKGAAPVTD